MATGSIVSLAAGTRHLCHFRAQRRLLVRSNAWFSCGSGTANNLQGQTAFYNVHGRLARSADTPPGMTSTLISTATAYWDGNYIPVSLSYHTRDDSLSCRIDTDWNSVSVLVTAPKLVIFLVSVIAVIVKHGFGLLSVTAQNSGKVSAWIETVPVSDSLAPPRLCT